LVVALPLLACSEPTGLPAGVRTPGTFAASFIGARLNGDARIQVDASEGEVIRLSETGSERVIEIAVGENPAAPTLSVLPPRDLPANYVRWVRLTVGGDAPIIRTYQLMGGSYEGRIGPEGTQMQMDLRLRLIEIGLITSTPSEVRLRGSVWGVWPSP
jgi:hypothetical protein